MKTGYHTPNLSSEELAALQGATQGEGVPAGDLDFDKWFKYRNAFLLIVVSFYAIRLLVFTDAAVMNLAVSADERDSLLFYFKIRAIFVIALACIYTWSYLRHWRFERVALITSIISITSLVMDYFNAYIFWHEKASLFFIGMMVVRLIATTCLILNSVNARRAPINGFW